MTIHSYSFNDARMSFRDACAEMESFFSDHKTSMSLRGINTTQVKSLLIKLVVDKFSSIPFFEQSLQDLKNSVRSFSVRDIKISDKIKSITTKWKLAYLIGHIESGKPISSSELEFIERFIQEIKQDQPLVQHLAYLCMKSKNPCYKGLIPLLVQEGAELSAVPVNDFSIVDELFINRSLNTIHHWLKDGTLTLNDTLSNGNPVWFELIALSSERNIGLNLSEGKLFDAIYEEFEAQINTIHNLSYRDRQGRSALFYLIPKTSPAFARALTDFLMDANFAYFHPYELMGIHRLCNSLVSDKSYDQTVHGDLLRKLIEKRVFVPGVTPFDRLLQEFEPEITAAYSLNASQKILLKELELLGNALEATDELGSLINIKGAILNILQKLENEGATYIAGIQEIFKEPFEKKITNRQKKAFEMISTLEASFVLGTIYSMIPRDRSKVKPPRQEFLDVLQMLMAAKNYDLLPHAFSLYEPFSNATGIYKPLFHFLGDKKQNPSTTPIFYAGGHSRHHGLILREALINNLENLEQDSTISQTHKLKLREFYPQFSISLACLAYLEYIIKKEAMPEREIAQKIMELIEDPERDFPLLIPMGSGLHRVVVVVDPLNETRANIHLFNTGDREESFHLTWYTDPQKRQLFVSSTDVPLKDLLNQKLWEEAVLRLNRYGPIKDTYDFFTSLTAQRGLVPRSLDIFDYSQPQHQGTCTAQVLMEAFRYYHLRLCSGSKEELMGLYKYQKNQLLIKIGRDRISHVKSDLKQVVESKLRKHQARAKLMEIVQNQDLYRNHVDCIHNRLFQITGVIGCLNPIISTMQTNFERFQHLQRLHRQLAEIWIKHPQTMNAIDRKKFDFAYSITLDNLTN